MFLPNIGMPREPSKPMPKPQRNWHAKRVIPLILKTLHNLLRTIYVQTPKLSKNLFKSLQHTNCEILRRLGGERNIS